MSISGTIPTQIGQCTSMARLYLHRNLMHGSIPTQIGRVTLFNRLYMDNNTFTGPIPSQIGLLSVLTDLGLFNNHFSGSIPSQIGRMAGLMFLSLFNSPMAGEIPSQMGTMSSLSQLYMYNNFLSGSLPSQLGRLTRLINLSLRANWLTGTIPTQLDLLTRLKLLDLSSNRFTGTFFPVTPPQLEYLLLHHNRLDAEIPPQISRLTRLEVLSLFDNRLRGSVPELCQSRLLLLFDNLLSCPLPKHAFPVVQSTDHANSTARTLVALGNAFPLDGWGLVRAEWLYAWDADSTHLFEGYPRPWVRQLIVLVFVCLIAAICWLIGRWIGVTWTRAPLQLWVHSLKLVLGLTGFALVYMTILAAADHLHKCANPLFQVTLAETTGMSRGMCGLVATCALFHFLGCVAGILWLRRGRAVVAHRVSDSLLPKSTGSNNTNYITIPVWRRVCLVLAWIVSICILNIPTLLNFMAASFPANNSQRIPPNTVIVLRWFMSPVLVLIGELIIPKLSNFFVTQYYARQVRRTEEVFLREKRASAKLTDERFADQEELFLSQHQWYENNRVRHEALHRRENTSLILTSQFLVLAVAPVLSQILVHEKCMRLTRAMWTPCNVNSTAFDISFVPKDLSIPLVTVLQRDEVCNVGQFEIDPGLCARGVIASTSGLNISKVLVQALFVLFRTAIVMLAVRFYDRTRVRGGSLHRFVRWVVKPVDDDTVTRSIMCLVMLGFVYGGVAPLIWPAVLIGTFTTISMWRCSARGREGLTSLVFWAVIWCSLTMQLLLGLWFFGTAPCGYD
eukprot:c616_g1_i1.p1 GENE.c616_g1_i1~~c616_g1_i1.p1  ORF type:complete len:817 (-),score=137.31 c616_g1_i1:50-2419(-)